MVPRNGPEADRVRRASVVLVSVRAGSRGGGAGSVGRGQDLATPDPPLTVIRPARIMFLVTDADSTHSGLDLEHRLRERVKELTALHRTSRILQAHHRPADELVREIVDLLPDAWQFPEVAVGRIRYRGGEFATAGFRETPWMQTAAFTAQSGDVREGGDIAIAYLEQRPPSDEGPFLAEERDLLESLAEMLRSHLEHTIADEALHAAHTDLEEQVAARTADLRRLASRLTLAEERERRLIASDLHDHVGQSLAMLKMRMREFRDNALFGGAEESIDEVIALLDQTIRYTRDLTGEISPPVLYELGLDPALQWLAERFSSRHGLTVRFDSRGRSSELPEELAVMMFRSARELLHNSQRHSRAGRASLSVRWGDDDLSLTVADRGCGFDPSVPWSGSDQGFGLFSIRERVGDLGGRFEIETEPGGGCRATIVVPIRSDAASLPGRGS